MKKINIIICSMVVVVLILLTFNVSYSYFDIKIHKLNDINIDISSGKTNLVISDMNLSTNEFKPIYDEDYKEKAYKIKFTLSNKNSNLNVCYSINMNFKYINPNLISEYIKYKIIDDKDNIYDGDLSKIKENTIVLVNDKFININDSRTYIIYLWLSYNDQINQINLLDKSFIFNIAVNSYDSKKDTCGL